MYLSICLCSFHLSTPDRALAGIFKGPAVRVPSLQRLSTIAGDLGLDFEKNELAEYRGEFFHENKVQTNYSLFLLLLCFFLDKVKEN